MELPPIFDEIVASPSNPLVQKALDQGRRAVGYTCSYVPAPILSVPGLMPLRVRAPGAATTPLADAYLSGVLCTYTRSVLQFAIEGRYDFLDGWVFAAGCDHLRRLYDNLDYLQAPAFNFIIDVPHKSGNEAVAWFEEELRRLATALAEHFDVDTGDQALAGAVARHNSHVGRLRAIGAMRRRRHPPISGTAFHSLMVAGTSVPVDLLTGPLEELRDRLDRSEGIDDFRARLMVVGSHMDDPAYLQVIESNGGIVVADRFCVGSIPGLEPYGDGDDPIRSMAEHALRGNRCPRMMEGFDDRVRDIVQAAGDFLVDGIIVQTMKFCDLWGIEAESLVASLRDHGIPILRVDREYAHSGKGQLKTRIQAFLESMGR